MQIDRKETGNNTATITVTVSPDDVKDKFKSTLKDYSSKAQIKGFRKGKTPVNFIKKMYGQALLADTVNEVMQAKLDEYIKEEKLDLLGQPLPTEDQEQIVLDPYKIEEATFMFDIATVPTVEVKAAADLGVYTKYNVELTDEEIDEEIENGKKRLGSQDSVEGKLEQNDLVTVKAQELDGDAVKEEGHETTFTILIDMIKNEDAKAKFLAASTGDSIDFDIYDLETNDNDEYVAKYLLKVEDNDAAAEIGRNFRGEIIESKRVTPAEENEEFFQKFTGDEEIKDKEAAVNAIKENLKKHYDRESGNLMKGRIASDLIEQHTVEFPEAFMKRWIQATAKEGETMDVDKEYDEYAKQLQWSIIKAELMKRHNVEVDPEEIKEAARDRVRSYFGGAASGINDEMIEGIVPRLLNDQQQLHQLYTAVEFDKLMNALAEEVTTEEKTLNTEEFKDVVTAYNEEMQAK